jgi:hypothetical protein
MFDEALTPEQLIVITALTEGLNSTDAAAQAGVHRNTIANWRRNSLFFREALADAQYDRALLFRDKLEGMLDLAVETIHTLLTDPETSPSVRLKAALFILGNGMTPPQPRKQVPFDIGEIRVHQAPPAHKVHKDQQTAPSATVAPEPAAAENPDSVHNNAQNAQTPFRRDMPKVGRNEPCPCGSGQKFKRCCLDKPQTKAA